MPSDDSVRQNLFINREESVVTNEELITPSSLSSVKSYAEVCDQEEPIDLSICNTDALKKDVIHRSPLTEGINDNKMLIG